MPPLTPPQTPTWTVICFFVLRAWRGRGLTKLMLDAAIKYARDSGGEVIEGYLFDTAGVSSVHFGHSSIFEESGFGQDGRCWSRTL